MAHLLYEEDDPSYFKEAEKNIPSNERSAIMAKAVEVVMEYLLGKNSFALPTPEKKRQAGLRRRG